MKNHSSLLALVVAILSGAFAFYFLNQKTDEIRRASTPMSVWVASRYIPAKSPLLREMAQKKEIPGIFVSPSAIRDLQEVEGLTTMAPISEGEQILANKFTQPGDSLALSLSPGFRAYTMEVSETTGVGNLLNPGDHVDVLAKTTSKERQSITAFVFQNIQVLAVGGKTGWTGNSRLNPNEFNGESGSNSDRITTYSHVTLAVTPEQAETLMFLEGAGNLRLLLRSPGDAEIVTVPRQGELEILARLGHFIPAKSKRIEVIRGPRGNVKGGEL